MLGKEFKTPVCKRNLNPIYPPEYATFEFPIYMSLVHKLGTLNLKFVVWNKDMLGNDFLGKNALPVNEWFKDTAFAFDDPHNQVCSFTIEIRFGVLHLFLSPFTLASFLHAQTQYLMGLYASKSALSNPLTRQATLT
jgi:hypothetical protein